MIRLGVIGAASTGKSALSNALFGTSFPVDARSGGIPHPMQAFVQWRGKELQVIDAPPLGLDAVRADAYLLVCDKDLTEFEFRAATRIRRPLGVALNKADTYSAAQKRQLLAKIRQRLADVVAPERVVLCAADPVRVVFQDGEAVYLPAAREVREAAALVALLIGEAERSTRVRAREFAGSLFRRS